MPTQHLKSPATRARHYAFTDIESLAFLHIFDLYYTEASLLALLARSLVQWYLTSKARRLTSAKHHLPLVVALMVVSTLVHLSDSTPSTLLINFFGSDNSWGTRIRSMYSVVCIFALQLFLLALASTPSNEPPSDTDSNQTAEIEALEDGQPNTLATIGFTDHQPLAVHLTWDSIRQQIAHTLSGDTNGGGEGVRPGGSAQS